MYILDITYQIISSESAKQGTYHDQGYEHEGLEFDTIEELQGYIERNYYAIEFSSSDIHNLKQCIKSQAYASTVDPDIDYTTGHETYYSFHIERLNHLSLVS